MMNNRDISVKDNELVQMDLILIIILPTTTTTTTERE